MKHDDGRKMIAGVITFRVPKVERVMHVFIIWGCFVASRVTINPFAKAIMVACRLPTLCMTDHVSACLQLFGDFNSLNGLVSICSIFTRFMRVNNKLSFFL